MPPLIIILFIIFIVIIISMNNTKGNQFKGDKKNILTRGNSKKYFNNSKGIIFFSIRAIIESGLLDKTFQKGAEYFLRKLKNRPKINRNSNQKIPENEIQKEEEEINQEQENEKIINAPVKENKLNIKELESSITARIEECQKKVRDIRDFIKDFDYSIKNTYNKNLSKITNDLTEMGKNINNIEYADIVDQVNEIIDEINENYTNAYSRKNNVSTLSYMETEEGNNLIDKINIDEFRII